MMGEASKLSEEESRMVTKRFLSRVGGKVPVIVGVSNPGTDSLLRFAKDSMESGAAGVMWRRSRTLRTEDQTFKYLPAFARGWEVPSDRPAGLSIGNAGSHFGRYDHKLIDACPQLVMLKHEDCPASTS